MLKKTVPFIVLSGILLVGCGSPNAFPRTDDTPMQDVRDDVRQWKNDAERDLEGNNFNNGLHQDGKIINERNPNEANNNAQVEIIEELNRKNNVH